MSNDKLNMTLNDIILPHWPVPDHIGAIITTRNGGVSMGSYSGFSPIPHREIPGGLNLALHVGDNEAHVMKNRQIVQRFLPNTPHWLEQVHGTTVIPLTETLRQSTPPRADGSVSTEINQVCAVMTADCMPILFSNKRGTVVSAIHGGWRGLSQGIIEQAIQTMLIHDESLHPSEILAYLGPAIGPDAFEVGEDVYTAFIEWSYAHRLAFKEIKPAESSEIATPKKYLANLYQIAKQRLLALGVHYIYGGDYCTFHDQRRFYSHRREQQTTQQSTGRMAALIWIGQPAS
jgi:YfiH family protein